MSPQNRDETRYENPDRFDVTRKPEHQAFGAGGRHFCFGPALARLELKIMIEETLKRYRSISLAGAPVVAGGTLPQPAQDTTRPARRSDLATDASSDCASSRGEADPQPVSGTRQRSTRHRIRKDWQ